VYGATELLSPAQVMCFPALSVWLAASLWAAVMTTSTSSATYEYVTQMVGATSLDTLLAVRFSLTSQRLLLNRCYAADGATQDDERICLQYMREYCIL